MIKNYKVTYAIINRFYDSEIVSANSEAEAKKKVEEMFMNNDLHPELDADEILFENVKDVTDYWNFVDD